MKYRYVKGLGGLYVRPLGYRRGILHHLAVFSALESVLSAGLQPKEQTVSGETLVKQTTASLLISALALSAFAITAAPAAAQSPAPPITVNGAPAGEWGDEASGNDAPAPSIPAAAPAPSATVVPAAAPPAAPAKKKSAEVLPWTDKPLVPLTGDLAALEAAAAQCSGLFEAACRDIKTCAWVADMTLEDGTDVPARCAARAPSPPKKTVKKTTPAKATAKAPEASAEPAVKAAATRVEDEEPKAKPARISAAADTLEVPKEPKVPTITEPKVPKAPEPPAEQAGVSVTPEEKQAAKAPIVVKPPPAQPAASGATMPSFGSMGGFGGMGNAVVVTVPTQSPSQ